MKELTKREREVLNLIQDGMSDHDVCRKYGLLPDQFATILKKLTARSETHPDSESEAVMLERALRRREENRARSLEARFLALMEASPEAILVVKGSTGEIRQANERAIRLFGFSGQELIERSVEELVPERWRAIHPAYRIGFLSSVRKREMGYHPPIFAQRADGSEIEVSVALTASTADDEVMVVCSEFVHWPGQAEEASEPIKAPS